MIPRNPKIMFLVWPLLAACGGGDASGPAAAAGPQAAGSSASSSTDVRASALAAAVDAALADAAQRSGRPRGELRVASSEAVVWPDGSLGCAEPGNSYTMGNVPGFRIVIEAAGQAMQYHANEGGYVKFCPRGPSATSAPAGTR